MTQKNEILIAKHFIKATKDILRTMAGLDAEAGTPFSTKNNPAVADISAIIGVTGDCKGAISVSFTREAAKTVLNGMLGEAVEDEENDMRDVVGEVTNMISGQARASLSGDGLTMQGSTPSVIAGKDHKIQHQCAGPAIAIPFTVSGAGFIVEFCFE